MAYPLRKSDDEIMIAPGAAVVGRVKLGRGVSVWYNAVIRGDEGPIIIGENTNVQECAVIHDATTIGAGCTIGHGAVVHGCTIGDNSMVGMGAVVLTGAKIGNNCLIGAGAVVTGKMDAPDGSVILGSPAKVVKEVTPEMLEEIAKDAQLYVQLAKEQM